MSAIQLDDIKNVKFEGDLRFQSSVVADYFFAMSDPRGEHGVYDDMVGFMQERFVKMNYARALEDLNVSVIMKIMLGQVLADSINDSHEDYLSRLIAEMCERYDTWGVLYRDVKKAVDASPDNQERPVIENTFPRT